MRRREPRAQVRARTVPRLAQAGQTAFDLVGKRWALGVVRELALGPWRFTDLHHRLNGIATSVLAARLRELQHANVVQRQLLPPPASSVVYELTDSGRELSRIALELEQWGERSAAAAAPDATECSKRQGKKSDVESDIGS